MHYLANVSGFEHFLAKKSRQVHCLTNVPGLEHFLAKNIPECQAGCLYKHHEMLLTCYQSAHLLSKGSTEGLHLLI